MEKDKMEAVYMSLDSMVRSLDKASPKERENFAPMHYAEQFNKLMDAAKPFVQYSELLPAPVGKGAMSSMSDARYLDIRTYAAQVRYAVPYVPSMV